MAASWRTSPLPKGWKRIRAQVLKRDGGRCTWPGCDAVATDVDHTAGPDDHRLEVLRSLCGPHHRSVTGRQAAAKSPTKWRSPRRAAEPHPGLK